MLQSSRSNALYALAILVLATSAVGIKVFDLTVLKKPLPIRKPLRDMDKRSLAPWNVVSSSRLPPELVQELGTEEYLHWILRSPHIRKSHRNKVSLSVTYYTDVQDQLPHVPEECQQQAGRTITGGEEFQLDLPGAGRAISAKRLTLRAQGESEKKNFVYYTLRVNDVFCSDRQKARLHMGDFRDTHLYYSKIEIAFDRFTDDDLSELDTGAQDLFDKVILELEKEHWPAEGASRNKASPVGDDGIVRTDTAGRRREKGA